ncbi:hypothetical protein [Gordonia malaquae]|uniref:hypothetical protein n=1 Tax=Gordonia malaquae TaxID=410332 RepID=UPI003017C137
MGNNNDLDRLARALKKLRPDFTLSNARTFAEQVAHAPGGVFGKIPLAYVPAPTTEPVRSGHTRSTTGSSASGLFPRAIALPLPDRVAMSVPEAVSMYDDGLMLNLGVDSDGAQVSIDIRRAAHWLVVSRVDAGGTSVVCSLIEQVRAAGMMTLIVDGKCTDFTGLIGAPNVVVVSQHPEEHQRVVGWAAAELRSRRAEGRGDRPPLMVFVTEAGAIEHDVEARQGSAAAAAFFDDLAYLMRYGRAMKVHVVVTDGDLSMRARLVLPLFTLRLAVGTPERKTILDVFPSKDREALERRAESMKHGRPGRALMTAPGLDSRDEGFTEIQCYCAPTPCVAGPPSLSSEHERYRRDVAQVIPALYPPL